jgi:hypothetical protein
MRYMIVRDSSAIRILCHHKTKIYLLFPECQTKRTDLTSFSDLYPIGDRFESYDNTTQLLLHINIYTY